MADLSSKDTELGTPGCSSCPKASLTSGCPSLPLRQSILKLGNLLDKNISRSERFQETDIFQRGKKKNPSKLFQKFNFSFLGGAYFQETPLV